jgi:hypothetical protein
MATETALHTEEALKSTSIESQKQKDIPRQSTTAALLKFLNDTSGWAGDDLEELLEDVYAMRGKVNFDVPAGYQSLQQSDSKRESDFAKAGKSSAR